MSKEVPEPILEPDLPIVDPHHHLWDYSAIPALSPDDLDHHIPKRMDFFAQKVYLADEALEDFAGRQADRHNVVATIFAQCGSFYDKAAPEHMQPVGEVRRVREMAAEVAADGGCASSSLCSVRLAHGIMGTCDLALPREKLGEALDAMLRFPGFRGVRCSPPYGDAFAEGGEHAASLDLLVERALVLDIWHSPRPRYDPEALVEFKRLALRRPDLAVVLDHMGGAVGPGMVDDEGDLAAARNRWASELRSIAAECPNVYCKIGGSLMVANGFHLHRRAAPISSAELAELLLPWWGAAIDAFGPERCMFESNFPVDKGQVSYRTLWNAFKRVAASKGLDEAGKRMIFAGTAIKVYGLDLDV